MSRAPSRGAAGALGALVVAGVVTALVAPAGAALPRNGPLNRRRQPLNVAAVRRVDSALGPRGVQGVMAVRSVNTPRPLVALTFDDGPHPVATPRILEVLAREHVPATFFVLTPEGHLRSPGREIVRQAVAEGHEVECHGRDHILLLLRPLQAAVDDELACRGALGELGLPARHMRPPYGLLSAAQAAAMAFHGLLPVLWSRAFGSAHGGVPAGERVARIVQGATPGMIILFHDRIEDAAHLAETIAGLRARGFGFARVDDLLSSGRPAYALTADLRSLWCAYRFLGSGASSLCPLVEPAQGRPAP